MNGLDTAEAVDILEDLLVEDCKCQARHELTEVPPCSVEVTHVYITSCRQGHKLICSAVAYYAVQLQVAGDICRGCRNYIKYCWAVTPV